MIPEPNPTQGINAPADAGPAWLAQLEAEESVLTRLLSSLRQVRAALLGTERQALVDVLACHVSVVQAAEEARAARTRWRQQLASQFGTKPEAVTLSFLAARLSADGANRLMACGQRLRFLVTEIDALNHANGSVIRHCQSFLQRLLSSLTGSLAAERYGPGGQRRQALCESLLEARG